MKESSSNIKHFLGASQRWSAVDCLRGLAIFFMAIVNHPGFEQYVYSPLNESDWIGMSPADLIFPTFIFVVGISIVLAFSRSEIRYISRQVIFKKIIKRAILLFLIGVIIHATSLTELRIPGVLQRISIVYACCSFLYFSFTTNNLVWLSAIILILYWIVLVFSPVPGMEHSSLTPTDNIAAWIDNYFLHGHLLHSTITWDPEGILSTFPAIVTGIIGMLVGKYLVNNYNKTINSIMPLLMASIGLIVLGLCWHLYFPIIKKLWTSSFVLWAAGWSLGILILLLYLIDIRKWSSSLYVFIAIGKNALFLYIVEELLGRFITPPLWLFENYFKNELSLEFMSFVFALGIGLTIAGLGYWLDRKRIYIKI